MIKCVFCGKEEHEHKGVSLIKNDGSVNYFCSSKCRNNAVKLKRDRRKIRWTEAFHITREKARVRAKAVAEKNAEKAKEEKERERQSKEDKKKTEKEEKKTTKKVSKTTKKVSKKR